MGLSYDLISEFVKITNDKKDDKKEGTVYATVVSGTEGRYVRIDGSDLLTPMDTTTDIEDGERVTLMIKDHKAIVTGNVTTPSASTTKVDKVAESVNSVSDRVGTFELVVADKVSTNELEAYKATIEVLIASKATIEDLTATNAKIENLEVKNAEIENLVAEKATIEDLEAVNATIENLKVKDAEIENAVVENLKATTADIKILNADFAQIKTLVNGNLTSDNILSFNLTSGKVTVDDAFIKDAMIDTVNAAKINAGRINTSSVSIGSEDGGMIITGSTQQFTDKNGNVRIQIGKDASGDFTFVLYGEDGTGQLINQNGITASAIGDGLIVNNMVSDNAAISGGKLDISSVIFEINNDTSTTIKSSKIYLNEQAQSLEVAFNSLKTKVDTIQEVTIQGDLTAIVEQVQSNTSKIEANKDSINTLISQDTVIKKQVTDLQGTLSETETTLNSKYTSLSQNLNGFKTTVVDTYATKKSVTDVVDNIESNYSTTSVMNSAIEQKAQEISASVSSTYATKNQVNTLDNNLKTNYSTTQQMESAINIAKEAINLGVSSIYETKENSTSKIQNAVNNIQVGGTNLLPGTKLLTAGINSPSFISSDTYLGFKIMHYKHTDDDYKDTYAFYSSINVEPNTEYTLSFYAKGTGYFNSYFFPKIVSSGINSNGSTTNAADGYIKTTVTSEWKRYWITWKTLPDASGLKDILVSRIHKGNDIYICGVKFEKGNKATEWTPSPGDVDSNIYKAKQEAITSANNTLTSTIANYYTKSQTDSQINIAKESINLGVSTTYETKANVETKVTSTLKSAKSYSDTKKSEAISTAASDATSKANTAKQEAITSANNTLTSTIANYYTKSQTDSQINIAKESINLGVSTTYETKENVKTKINNVTVGGTNLLPGTKLLTDGIASPSYVTSDTYLGFKIMHHKGTTDEPADTYMFGGLIDVEPNTEYTLSFYAKGKGYLGSFFWPNTVSNGRNSNGVTTNSADGNINTTVTSEWKRYWITWKTLPDASGKKNVYISRIYKGNEIYICGAKFEKGNKATDWSPAPKDVADNISTAKSEAISTAASDATSKANKAKQEAITSANNTLTSTIANYYTKSQTDSQINIAKESINLGVSNTYETKANVETKVTSTLKSAKSYSDTKKSEAISTAASDATSKANKAKQEAITSANNTLTSTIANYYTKSQTDSQINIAKEAINLGVSTTYETKENSTSKIQNAVNNIQVGGTNLLPGTKLLTDGIASPSFISSDTYLGFKIMHHKGTTDEPADTYVFGGLNVEPNTEYTLSFYAKGTGYFTSFFYPNAVSSGINSNGNTTNAEDGHMGITVTSEWKRYWITWKTLPNVSGKKNVIVSRINKGNDIYICGVKFEKGNKATEWTPSPGDVDSNIYKAKQEAITSANNTLTSTISNYYTKSQTDSQINVAKNAINLGVSNTYETKANVEMKINNIKVGGTNLLPGTKLLTAGINSPSFISSDTYLGFKIMHCTHTDDIYKDAYAFYGLINVEPNTEYTLSFYAKGKGYFNSFFFPNTVSNGRNSNGVTTNSADGRIGTTVTSEWKRYWITWKTLSNASGLKDILVSRIDKGNDIYICGVKFEKGNKATEWSPAPEDVESDITSIESETRSIKQTVSSLVLGTDSISASVKSLEESMINTTNGLASDISKVQKQVNLAMTSSDVKLEIQKELADGVKKVSTSTGFTFDENGLNISKSDSEMKTQITEDGMKIYKNSEVMLTANNQGVDAKNLHATTYLIIGGNSRMEDFTENGSKRTAVFWIG